MSKTILSKDGYLLKKSKYTEEEIINIKKELTVSPVMAFKLPNMKKITYPVYTENDKYLCVPKFYGLKKFGKPDKDREIEGLKVDFEFRGKPKEKQLPIIEATKKQMEEKGGGLICAGCGVGKTFMALYLAHYFGVKTLIVVHKTFLLNQWMERIAEFTNANVGKIQQKTVDVEDKQFVVGMLQSIAKDNYDRDIYMDFGLIIFDEAHHAPSQYFSQALPIINCKLSLALSATPNRADKMEKVLYWYLGDIAYKAPPNENENVQVRIYNYDVKNEKYKEAYMKTGDVNRPRTINRVVKIKKRNKFIIQVLNEIMEEKDRQCLILSDRIEHLEILKEKIDKDNKYTCSYYIGGMKQDKLDESAKSQVLLGSYGMASEGLDIPSLNSLILATPRKSVEQSVGRIVRRAHNVRPIVVDIVDSIPCLHRQGYVRRKLYNKLKFEMTLYEMEDSKVVNTIKLDDKKKTKTFNKKQPVKKTIVKYDSDDDDDYN